MRGDETQPAIRKGPRHAAPRKSLLTKLQAPAGKAMALAAMPTAVLVGLGMTPKLALADEKDIPFAPGPCVTRSDEPSESEQPKETESPAPKPSQSATEPPGADDEKEPIPGASPSASATEEETTEPKAGATKPPATTSPAPSETPTPTPTPTETRNPLDPLGVGDAIKDIFDGPDEETEPTATPSTTAPTTSAPTTPPPSDEPTVQPPVTPAEKDDVKDTEVVDDTKEAIKDAADKAGAEVEELPEDVKGLDPKKDEDIPEGAKPRFPCPTADPEALAAAELEPGIPLLPDEPWKLESTKLTLRGLDYHGIVEVKTYGGKVKKVLKFTASEVDIKDLHQLTAHSEGHTGHVTSRPGSESTIRGGTVTMYTESLKGNLFGIIPIEFSPDSPPPLNVPYAFFTDVKVTQAGQFGGTLTVPGLKNFIEG
ncbi:hypothetical protein E2C00_20485 [Streptomyces sp. WAC05374]|uniref:hypothetical protein n=2 Tax=Streptomyces sp. WAC05374 TaxID=2487420 RepID=UPI0010542279|nr:hypothetical protein E2B92_28060 [Streptomyces sp. WAC05374]TDF53491.1 hypothetical protein E2C00_20485 [Streptomyces sp. WAC05374]TDF59338.1 hypothetical protein E2C02_05965 [Streptomyces sp. WAC05374]